MGATVWQLWSMPWESRCSNGLMTAKKHQKTWLNPTYPMENPMTSIETWQFTQLLFKWYTCHPSVVEDKM